MPTVALTLTPHRRLKDEGLGLAFRGRSAFGVTTVCWPEQALIAGESGVEMNDRRPANVSLPDEAAASADTTPGRDEDVQDARSASVIDVEARGWGCPVDTVGRILMDASPKMFTDPPPRPRKVGRKRQLLLLGCGFAVGFLLGSRAGRPTYQWLFAHSQALLKSVNAKPY